MSLLSVNRASSHLSRYSSCGSAILLPLALLAGCGSGGTPTVFTPSISPAPGAYTQPITITLSAETPGASIYYIESTTGQSTLYTSPFQVATTETIQVIGVAKGYNSSSPMVASYIVERPTDIPVIFPASGSYAGPLTVTISDATPHAIIYYTTNGSTPTVSSTPYTGPFSLTASADYTITSKQLTWACLSGCGVNAPPSGPGGGSGSGGSAFLQAMGWTDLQGNLWMFGGNTQLGTANATAALWRFNVPVDLWQYGTNIGSLNTPGIYGTLGVPAASNVPGARFGGYTWTDAAGNFWLFGGEGYDINGTQGLLNDLWTCNPNTMLWTWMGGSNTINASGVYGTMGTAAAPNIPGAREAGVAWKDATGKFWLFGANGWDANGTKGQLNDLWSFSPSTGQWTWISGSSAANPAPNYGTVGLASATNTPGGYLGGSVSSVDAAGDLLITSGVGASSNAATDLLNTTWKFKPTTGQWTWLSGSDVGTVTGSYGILGTPSATDVPGSRQVGLGWTDTAGNLWSFGGFGVDSTGAPGYLNDMWQFNPALSQWTWIAGSNTINASPSDGSPGYPSLDNVSGARAYSVGWTGIDGTFYFFGGYGINSAGQPGYLGDLWQFTP